MLLLTMMNEPAGAAGTSGSVTRTGSAVEREQMRVAARTYRLRATGPSSWPARRQAGEATATIGESADLPERQRRHRLGGRPQKPNPQRGRSPDQDPQISLADLVAWT
jgi:hypothetical protein